MSTLAAPSSATPSRQPENLALVFQEILTVIERMRSHRQPISDAGVFRQQVREALRAADQEARRRGYTAEDIQLAIFAVVAFLDETILNLRLPVFADWTRQPLQEELFGHHIAGEVFFQNLQTLLGRNDSQQLADLLEVYQLCLLLGFAGRYAIGGRGELRAIIEATALKIKRIRQSNAEISPRWRLPAETFNFATVDVWVKRLLYGAIACVAVTVLLFVIYKMSLASGISSLRELTAQAR
ncbi:MAG: type IVB secretion system protein IcmH/DotU [Bryobacteraceae bacterium]|nr:type IVB secretion system protein IcmH/DotU [Bryobacteraceae bacterium]MDW8380231.1 type IVB secretion system protein IcmH/DotU [Bryobacterales bacterium]